MASPPGATDVCPTTWRHSGSNAAPVEASRKSALPGGAHGPGMVLDRAPSYHVGWNGPGSVQRAVQVPVWMTVPPFW